jgi:hypothetical protein
MVFAAAWSQLIHRADPELGWVGSLAFGAMAVWIGVTLVANGTEGGAAWTRCPGTPTRPQCEPWSMGIC